MKKFFIISLLLLQYSLVAIVQIPDAQIDDDFAAENNEAIENKDDETTDSKIKYKLYSITNLLYSPIKTGNSFNIGSSGIFKERISQQQINGELSWQVSRSLFVKVDLQLQFSTNFPTSNIIFEKGSHDWTKLNELFLEWQITSRLSVLIGKYRRIFSPGIFQNPMDRHNRFVTPSGLPIYREGNYLAELNFQFDTNLNLLKDISFSSAFLPNFFLDKNGIPLRKTAVFTVNKVTSFLSKKNIQYNEKYFGGYAKLYANFLEGDLNLIYYYLGQQSQLGTSYSKYVWPWLEVHGEVLVYERVHDSKIISQVSSSNQALADALTGIRFEINENNGFILEYLYRGDQLKIMPTNPTDKLILLGSLLSNTTTKQIRAPLKDYMLANFYLRNIKDIYSFTLTILYGIINPQALISLKADVKIGDHARFSFISTLKKARSGTYYDEMVPYDYQIGTEVYVVF